MPPQCRRHDAHRFEEAPGHAQKTDLQRQRELERRTAPLLNNTPYSVGEVEERFDLKGTQIARQSAPTQTRRMAVLHVPTLRESAYNTPAETPNNKSLRRLQKLRTTSRITEESYRHFWHVNQGEAEKYVPTTDPRCRVSNAKALGVLLRSIVVEREPIYRAQETVHGFATGLFGVAGGNLQSLSDDRLGRALDHLFEADRAALLTEVVLAVAKRFAVQLEQLHNDSTSISFCGQYRDQRASGRSGKRAPTLTYGYSKDHRPDLKQLLFILTPDAEIGR